MGYKPLPVWKKAPFIRYIIPLSAGIILQWNYHIPFYLLLSGMVCCVLSITLLNISNIADRFRFSYAFGISIYGLLFFVGCLLVYLQDDRNSKKWYGHHLTGTACMVVNIVEPLSEKTKTYKAMAGIEKIIINDSIKNAGGRLILYLKKEAYAATISQGSRLLINATLKPIGNFENSTGFDYSRYCALQHIYHQAYLKQQQYIVLSDNNATMVGRLLSNMKARTLDILRKYIKGPKEAGLAEALLIGYKDDLDKQLVRSYSNTGVVHIIAISGLHVGLIYAILLLCLKPFARVRFLKWAEPFILLSCLWLFSLLAGGSPSVLRSAVMFSGIVIGRRINRSSSIYNSLAASAFLLLCFNPMWIYDVGFQLSYLAVLSLAMFMKRIYDSIYIQNKLLDLLWNLASVTLAAQVLTIPVCLHYFRQFPNMFLIANMITVPLSSVILIAEIVLCCVSFYHPLAAITGQLLEWLIKVMNGFVLYVEKMPFALTENAGISAYQVVVLYAIIFIIADLIGRKW